MTAISEYPFVLFNFYWNLCILAAGTSQEINIASDMLIGTLHVKVTTEKNAGQRKNIQARQQDDDSI
ncbi:hypothetical protein [Nitrososphaera viennensis]|nr:hypothetical protein [Nitrososphaera viennensis]